MKDKRKIIIIAVSVLIFIALVLYSSHNENKKKLAYNNSVNTYKNEFKIQYPEPTQDVNSDDKDINTVKTLFIKEMESGNIENLNQIDDYKVNEISIVSGETKKDLIDLYGSNFATESDILCRITYSVKPKANVNMQTIGADNKGWVTYPSICASVRDGKIKIYGTSW